MKAAAIPQGGVIAFTEELYFRGMLYGYLQKRYSSGMIFLLIFPIHYAFNTIWLLFEGSWNNPPTWGIYALTGVGFFLGSAIVLSHRRPE